MRALTQNRYGGTETLEFTEIERPVPGPGQVLVRVRAASINAYDWHVMRGDPRLFRAMLGLRRPTAAIRGRDFAGQVEAAGPGVTGFRAGDEVFGDTVHAGGAFAEFVVVPAEQIAHRPAGLTPEAAAALPLAGVTALQGVRHVRPGQRILINGASGGVGTFAVQLAKTFGAEVAAVCSTRNTALVESLGADVVVDYTRADFTDRGDRYHVILDLVGNRSLADLRSVLAPGGTLILSGGGVYRGGSLFGPMGLVIRARLTARLVKDRILVLEAVTTPADLTELAELVVAGRLTPVIDRTFPLSSAAAAIDYLETEHARAKVVVTAD